MVNVDKHVTYWLNTADDSWSDAEYLLQGKRYSFAAFAAHLALEKVLKAHVTRVTGNIPPKIHDLQSLAKRADLALSEEQMFFLGEMNAYQIEGRYGEAETVPPDPKLIRLHFKEAEELFQWLKLKL